MIKRLIPLTLALFATLSVFAQVPTTVGTEGEFDPSNSTPSLVVCPAGVSAFAGTSSQALAATAQSNDVEFLCINDALEITHLGGQTFGDPDASSAPGISYAFYTCEPTISGVDFLSIQGDPCHLNPNFPTLSVTVDQTADILGNSTFTNSGFLQTTYNAGAPFELFFAPITLDDHGNFLWENDGMGGPSGPCIHANTNDDFRVVYLNEVEGLNINTTANGPCGGSFELAGGLPEFDNSNYTNISISLASDPSVTANINGTTFTHGDVVEFNVPQPGVYNVVIEDGKSCSANFTVNMATCIQLESSAANVTTLPAATVCVEVTANNFTQIGSFQYSINYDPTILTFTTINTLNIPADLLIFGSSAPGQVTVSWQDPTFGGFTVADGTPIYEICFTAIGALGETSPVIFSETPTPSEVTTTDGINSFFIGAEFTNGSVTISNNSITLNIISCSTTTDMGTITVTPSGGAAPYNVAYVEVGNPGNNGLLTFPTSGLDYEFTGLTPGTYDITATDANGDLQTGTITVVNTDPLLVQINETNPTCPFGTDGAMAANINGGVSPISTLWSNGATTNIIDNLPQGMYDVIVTDNNGCTATASESIFVNSIMFDTLVLDHISCTGGPNSGAITIEATGGTGAFTYSWNTGETGPSITGVPAGSYTVTANDANSCSAILSVTINPPTEPVIMGFDSIPVACPSDMTGELTPNVDLGNAPIINYQWGPNSGNQTTETAVGLSAGTYSVTITDQAGCTAESSYTLTSALPLIVDAVSTPASCSDVDDGEISLMISGGTPGYQVLWENGLTINPRPGLACDSSYLVRVTDAGGCDTFNLSVFVDCPAVFTVSFAAIDSVDCNQGIPCDGGATATASGGTPGPGGVYSYVWSSGESNSLVATSTSNALCQGIQTVEVTDNTGCTIVDTVMIPAPTPLNFDLQASTGTPISCFGDSDGSITVVAGGGVPGYTYNWTNPVATGATVNGLPAGNNYFVVVTDANGCTLGSTFGVPNTPPLVAEIDTTNSFGASCFGLEDGQAVATHTGGTPGGYTYAWTPNVSTQSTAINLGVGTYTVTVTDINGCEDDVSYTVMQPEPIFVIVAEPVEPLCNGLQTVVTLDSVSGGADAPFRFSVDFGPPQFETAAIPILAGQHTVTVFDADNCSTEVEISVNEPFPVLVDLGPDTTIQLGESLELDPAINSPLPIDTLIWNPLTFLDCSAYGDTTLCFEPIVSPLETQMYELTVIDTNGCFGTDQIIVDIDKNRNVFIPNAFSPNGDGVNDFFRIYTGVGVQQVNYFRIYDRWGEQLFQDDTFLPGDAIFGGWDGRFKGKVMDNGVFIYIAEVQFIDGIVLLYRGDVTLVR